MNKPINEYFILIYCGIFFQKNLDILKIYLLLQTEIIQFQGP